MGRFRPDVLLTEKTTVRCRKGRKTKEVIEGIAAITAEAELDTRNNHRGMDGLVIHWS